MRIDDLSFGDWFFVDGGIYCVTEVTDNFCNAINLDDGSYRLFNFTDCNEVKFIPWIQTRLIGGSAKDKVFKDIDIGNWFSIEYNPLQIEAKSVWIKNSSTSAFCITDFSNTDLTCSTHNFSEEFPIRRRDFYHLNFPEIAS